MLVVSEDTAHHAEIDLSGFDMHEAPVRGREKPVLVYAVPDASSIADSIAPERRRNETSDAPVV